MVKIKKKKTMNLPQLIEWGFENTELTKGRIFIIDDENARFAPYVSFLADGTGVRVPCTITHDNTFTVTTEEEITEDTHLDYLYVLTDAKDVHRCNNFTIKTASMVIGRDDLTFFTLIDNDLVKIYDKGKLVE